MQNRYRFGKPIDSNLLVCPSCEKDGKFQALGKLTDNGLEVLRFHHGTTFIRASSFEVVCGCGYSFATEGTVVVSHYG